MGCQVVTYNLIGRIIDIGTVQRTLAHRMREKRSGPFWRRPSTVHLPWLNNRQDKQIQNKSEIVVLVKVILFTQLVKWNQKLAGETHHLININERTTYKHEDERSK